MDAKQDSVAALLDALMTHGGLYEAVLTQSAPLLGPELTEQLRSMPRRDAAWLRRATIALFGDPGPANAALQAIEDRRHGRVAQAITGADGGPIETRSRVEIYLPANGRELITDVREDGDE